MTGAPPGLVSSDRPAGRTGRRRALPPGRALVGGFAISVAVVLVFAGWLGTRSGSAGRWIVASSPLPAGTRLTPADLTTTSLRLGAASTAVGAVDAPGALIGRNLSVAVGAGELILRSEVVSAPSTAALRPVPVTVAPADLVDLSEGDLVDILETSGTAPATRTTVVVRGARVINTTQPSSGLLGSGGDDVITLGVTSLSEITAVIGAEHAGTVDVVVGEPSDGTGGP